jgi:hypothetical protein
MTKRTKEFGHLATIQDQILYMLVEEQRKTNELLSQLIEEKEEKKGAIEDATVRRTRSKASKE